MHWECHYISTFFVPHYLLRSCVFLFLLLKLCAFLEKLDLLLDFTFSIGSRSGNKRYKIREKILVNKFNDFKNKYIAPYKNTVQPRHGPYISVFRNRMFIAKVTWTGSKLVKSECYQNTYFENY